MRMTAILALSLSVASCAPTTHSPRATPQEIAREELRQEAFVRQAKLDGLVRKQPRNTKPIAKRLKAVASRIAPASSGLCRDLKFDDPSSCAYAITPERSNTLNAYADGEEIYITNAMVRFTKDDDELAMIIAHESAHNLMSHIDSTRGNIIIGAILGAVADAALASQTGGASAGFSDVGAEGGQLIHSISFEQEADYIALYLLARAGYDYHQAPNFWRILSLEQEDAIYISTSHPTNPERYATMQKVIAEIDEKKRNHLPLIPNFTPPYIATKTGVKPHG